MSAFEYFLNQGAKSEFLMKFAPASLNAMHLWIEHKIEPGSFMQAVLKNNLSKACSQADDMNKNLLWEWCFLLYNYAPYSCWGNEENYENWKNS